MKFSTFTNKILFFISVYSAVALVYALDPCSDQFDVVTDITLDDCGEDFYQSTGNDVHTCFPTCAKKWDYENPITPWCNPRKCPPGYKCMDPVYPMDEETVCEIDENSCFKYEGGNDQTNPWKRSIWKPECLLDGTWAPKQCKPSDSTDGWCYCFDAVGNRIFGQEFSTKASNMTCACSRKRSELMKSNSRFYVSLHCDTMGNYEPLQCDSGQCWCVEPMTGEITATVVPEKMMSYLPCYKKENVGDQYLRQCESEEYAKAYILHELQKHGTEYANFPHVLCDADGTYGPYQITKGQAICSWKDKSTLVFATSENLHLVDCNCARDQKIYELAGMEQNLKCSTNGNYNPEQQGRTDGKWYCVDSDGFRKSEYFDVLAPGDCIKYRQ